MSEEQQAVFGIQKIYLKDMSLEIPSAPQIFLERESPQIDVNIHNEARGLEQQGLYEVVLTATVTAKIKDKTVFLVEAAQAGIFEIRNISQQDLDAVLGVVCPNTLLPYAREAVASTVTRAGFPPVVLQHMSFEAVYQQRLQQLQQQQQQPSSPPPAH
ncbi:MAG: protein-export chaperone SecB [Betaproteobacteria bacterium RIFCSPLOWO2_12_FULL_62_13]|nr:MAG: protein-export chaperone SecB [Betaproteobacteria bacterium RIFCSPLOWO2_12_FULL_62_13]